MNEILLVSGNPRRRRKSKKTRARRRHTARRSRRVSRRHVTRARRNPRHRRSHSVRRIRARRNPVALSVGSAMGTIKSGAMGAVGGILNDLAIGYGKGYLPAMLATGYGLTATKLASAVLVGYVSDKVMRGKGKDFAIGAATVALHDAFKTQLASMVPTLPLGEYMDSFGNPSNPSLLGYNPGEVIQDYDSGDEVGEYIVGDYNDDTF